MHFSMVKLPDNPMMPRVFDERVGYFNVQQVDYGRDEHRAQRRRYITRWRLEKKDPAAALSEPVKPIVFYVDPATPTKSVPFIKRGIESWQPAFEEAGFKNAILAKDAPTKEQDPDWSAEDARYSVIRWLPSTTENAFGPHISDPRTGEILEADIQMHHNVMNLLRSWYFVQVAPLDPRAAKLPLPDDLMGQLVEHVDRARGRALARVPAQHEGELHVSRRESARPRVGEEDGPHADADGLLALQLRRAARGPHRSGGSHSTHRALRPLGDDVGLQADSGREDAGRGEEDARRVGAGAGRDAVAALLHGGLGRRRSGRADRSGRRRRRGSLDDDGPQESRARGGHAADGDDEAGRAVRRSRGDLRAAARTVGARDEPRRRASSAACSRGRRCPARTVRASCRSPASASAKPCSS